MNEFEKAKKTSGIRYGVQQNVLNDVNFRNLGSMHSSTAQKSPQVVPVNNEVFCGFPKTEINGTQLARLNESTNSQNCININQNCSCVNHRKSSLNLPQNVEFRWIQGPCLLYKYNVPHETTSYKDYCLKIDGQCCQVATTRFNIQCPSERVYASQSFYQDMAQKKYQSNKVTGSKLNGLCESKENQCPSTLSCKINDSYMAYVKNNERSFDSNEFYEHNKHFYQESQNYSKIQIEASTNTSAIKENGYSTLSDIQEIKADNIMKNLTVHNGLKLCIENFLKRAEKEISIETPGFPHTRTLRPESYVPFAPKDSVISTQSLEENANTNLSDEHTDGLLDSINTDANKNVEEPEGEMARERKRNIPKHARSEKLEQRSFIEAQTPPNDTDFVFCKSEDLTKFDAKHNIKSSRSVYQNVQAESITELAAFKKQYYDALLDVQRTKVAVANSLTIPTVQNPTRCNPYFVRCFYQQRKQQQQHKQHVTVNSQFAVRAGMQTELSNMCGKPFTWLRCGDQRYPLRQFRFQQLQPQFQSPSTCSRNQNWNPQNARAQNGEKESGLCTKRKKLEDIVDKLREAESNETIVTINLNLINTS